MAKKAASKRSTTKKTTKATARKKTAKKAATKAPTKKKPAAKRASSKKPTTTKKATKSPSSKKKPVAKVSKKKVTKATAGATTPKPPAKASARKPSAKASADKPAKSAGAKKPVEKTAKEVAPAKVVSDVKAASKPAPKRAPSRKPSASKAKSSSRPKSESKASIKDRWKGSFSTDIPSSVDAATRLAAAAGLRPLHERQTSVAVTEDYKRLTKTPFKKRDLDRYKEILRLKRAQVTGDVNDMETEALIGRGSGSLSKLPQHMADAGSDTYDQSLNLDLAAGQRKLLKEIDDALIRIENKTYGICELLGKPISKERLDNTPWARYSIEGARRKEMLGY